MWITRTHAQLCAQNSFLAKENKTNRKLHKIVHSKCIVLRQKKWDWTDENAYCAVRRFQGAPKEKIDEKEHGKRFVRRKFVHEPIESHLQRMQHTSNLFGIWFYLCLLLLGWLTLAMNKKFTCAYRIPCSCCIFHSFCLFFGTPQIHMHACTLKFQIQENMHSLHSKSNVWTTKADL